MRDELKRLEEEEEELETLSKEERDTQEIADAEYKTTVDNLTNWRDDISKLYEQANTLLVIMDEMSSK